MTATENLLVVGKLRAERKRSIAGMAAAAKMPLVAMEDAGEALQWLEQNAPGCVIVEAQVGRIDKIIGKIRSKPAAAHVPVFALVQAPDDLFIEQYFGWGGDDIVPEDAGTSLLDRLKSVPREAPKSCAGRRVLLADPDKARLDVIARVFAQAGFEVKQATDRASLESAAKQFVPSCIVANSVLGNVAELVTRTRQSRSKPGWVVLSARRETDAVQESLMTFERCAVLGLQSNPWQVLYRANEVARIEAVERRFEPRRHFGSAVLFRAAGGDDDDIGTCFNLSSRGMFLRTFAPLAADKVWLEWRIPREKMRIRLEGNVVWRQASLESTARFPAPLGFGIEFVDALGSSRSHLERLLESLDGAAAKFGSSPPVAVVATETAKLRPVPMEPPTLPKSDVPMGPDGAARKPVRAVSLPPRPAGSVVTAPNRPQARPAEIAPPQVPMLGMDLTEEGPNSSELTDVVKNPLAVFDDADSLPAFSHPDFLPAFGIDDAPTVVTSPSPNTFSNPVTVQPSDALATLHFQEPLVDEHPEATSKPRRWLAILGAGAVLGLAFVLAFVMLRPGAKSEPRDLPHAAARTTVVASAPSAETTVKDATDAGVAPELSGTVTVDQGDALPGYPPVEETQADQGRMLSDRYGYLVVRFPEPAFIFSDSIAIGPVNSKIATTCGDKTLRIGVGEKPATYLSDVGQVTVACRSTTRVIFRRLPGVAAPPNALRPLPTLAQGAKTDGGEARAKKAEPAEAAEVTTSEGVKSGAGNGQSGDESKSASPDKAADSVPGVAEPAE